jgi:hypothetical protein
MNIKTFCAGIVVLKLNVSYITTSNEDSLERRYKRDVSQSYKNKFCLKKTLSVLISVRVALTRTCSLL